MNLDAVTIQDCIEMAEKKGKYVVIKAGHIEGFVKEEK